MKIKLSGICLIAAGISTVAHAAGISVDQASAAVQAWIAESPELVRISHPSVKSAETVSTASGSRLHIVKIEGGGFAVTSADDRIDPVIAFVREADELVQDDANPLWTLLSGDIAARERASGVSTPSTKATAIRAASAASSSSDASARAQARWAALLAKSAAKGKRLLVKSAAAAIPDTRVDTLVQTRWSQSTHNNLSSGDLCYNYYTPGNYVCGCVATVGAQLMRYWQWPQSAVTAKSMTCKVDGESALYTMMGGTYDWSSMPLVPSEGATEMQRQAIGKIMFDVGVSVNMAWEERASSANTFALAKRLTDTFSFANAKAAIYIDGYYPYSLDELKKAVIPDCNAGAPLAMSIDGPPGGHATIVDGYGYSGDDFYIHVNLGWGGLDDAWYMPPNVSDFTTINGFVMDIFPQKTGSIISGRVLDAAGAPIANASVSLKRNSSLSGASSTTTDAKGIYAFIASAGNYRITASCGDKSASIDVSLAATYGTSLTDSGAWYNTRARIGSTYDSDIALTGIESAPPPMFTPGACMFYPSTNVTLTCEDPSAVIRYTTDGTDPTESSSVYSGPIFVDYDTMIKARTFSPGKNPSAVVAATYTYDASQGAPKGDYFADPINITGASGSRVIDDNSAYTIEGGEPLHTLENYSYWLQYHTAWYKWTAPGSGTMTFSVELELWSGATAIAAYTGETLSSLSRIDFSGDAEGTGRALITINVEQGVTYRIVGLVLGEECTGTFTLTWSGELTEVPTETSTTEVPVQYDWLSRHFPESAASEYETVAHADSDGDGIANWAEYLLGTDPTNSLSKLEVTIRMDGTTPIVESNADAARLAEFGYQPVLKGKQQLDTAADWAPTNLLHRFFKIFVEKQ